MILISINLGIINLLPIPIVDGGMILVSFIEFIIRKKLPDNFYKIFGYIGYIIVGLLMLLGFGNDLYGLLKKYVFFT